MISTKVGSWDNPYWAGDYEWGCTNRQHIWECVTTGYFHFSDEASQFDIWGYDCMEDCEEALDSYCASLDGK